jgi:hypothetical protein
MVQPKQTRAPRRANDGRLGKTTPTAFGASGPVGDGGFATSRQGPSAPYVPNVNTGGWGSNWGVAWGGSP